MLSVAEMELFKLYECKFCDFRIFHLKKIISVDCALQKSKKRAVLLDSWARNFRYLLRTQRKTSNNRKMLKRCDPPAYLDEELIFRLNFVQYSGIISNWRNRCELLKLTQFQSIIMFSKAIKIKHLIGLVFDCFDVHDSYYRKYS